MKIAFPVAAFAEAARVVRSIPDASARIPILHHARLEAGAGAIALTMTDLDIEARVTIEGKADTPVDAAIPADMLDFFLKRAGMGGEGSIEFAEDLNRATARHGRAQVTLSLLKASDFPSVPRGGDRWSFTLTGTELGRMLRMASPAISTEETRYFLNGVCLDTIEGDLVAVATDGHRMHKTAIDPPEGCEGVRSLIVPSAAVKEILRIFGEDEAPLTISGTEARMTVAGDRIRLTTKLVDAVYPDWRRVVIDPTGGSYRLQGKALSAAIDALATISSTDVNGKKVTERGVDLVPADGALRIGMAGDTGDGFDEIEAAITGEPVPIRVQSRLLREAIAAAPTPEIEIAMDGDQQLRLRAGGPENVFIIMGMRRGVR